MGQVAEQFIIAILSLVTPYYMAYVSKNTQHLIVIFLCVQLVSILAFYLMPEAPRYLAKSGCLAETVQSFETIARFNGVPLTEKGK